MSLEINTQYKKFAQFAELQPRSGNEAEVVRDGGASAGRAVTAVANGHVHKWSRGTGEQNATDRTRTLFQQAIRDRFDGKEETFKNLNIQLRPKHGGE